MGRGGREVFEDKGFIGVIILALVIAGIISAIFWIIVIGISGLIIYGVYNLTQYIDRIWLKIVMWTVAIIFIITGGSFILKHYGQINNSIIDYSFNIAQELRLKKSNKGNIKIESNYGTLIETKK